MKPEYQRWLLRKLYKLIKREKPNHFEFVVPWGKTTWRTIIVSREVHDGGEWLDLNLAPATA
jgi:hypothetical protein